MLRIAILLSVLALTGCAHYVESGDMSPAEARAIAGVMRQ